MHMLNKAWQGNSQSSFPIFATTGWISSDKAVKLMAPFTKNYQNTKDCQKIVYVPFIDYETGETKEGAQSFK